MSFQVGPKRVPTGYQEGPQDSYNKGLRTNLAPIEAPFLIGPKLGPTPADSRGVLPNAPALGRLWSPREVVGIGSGNVLG